MSDTYDAIQFKSGKVHAVWSLNPHDPLYETFCGRHLRYYDEHRKSAGDERVTCQACRRSLSARADASCKAANTLAIGQEPQI